jgi:predicted SAM-dependent methyltransferase
MNIATDAPLTTPLVVLLAVSSAAELSGDGGNGIDDVRLAVLAMKLNLGCGSTTPAGWHNVDYALGARLAGLPGFAFVNSRLRLFDLDWAQRITIHDLRKDFPWPDGSAEAIYSSHTFEHLTRAQGGHFMREAYRVLRPGGRLRLVVPDLEHIVARYRSGDLAADRFVEELGVLPEPSRSRWKSRLAPFIMFPHKCMYDKAALLRVFVEHGYNARPCNAYDSEIVDIRSIELAERTVHAVIVEGTKVPRAGTRSFAAT